MTEANVRLNLDIKDRHERMSRSRRTGREPALVRGPTGRAHREAFDARRVERRPRRPRSPKTAEPRPIEFLQDLLAV